MNFLFLQFSQVNIDEPMFQPFPSEIYFQNFEPYEVYEVPLILRNNDKVRLNPRAAFKVIKEHNQIFQVFLIAFKLQDCHMYFWVFKTQDGKIF